MAEQQAFLEKYLRDLGLEVELQTFQIRHPQTGAPVEMKNIIARWNPQKKKRLIVCTHYDTRPFPDRDPRQPQGIFLGANDGASGTAGLLELAHALTSQASTAGVDLIFFDGEEFVFDENRDRENYFLGSKHFARSYVANKNEIEYTGAVLLDMIGDKELQVFYEKNSFNFARDLTRELWMIADELKVKEFVPRVRHEVRDDHLPLIQIAKIPACNIIDFDYPRAGLRTQSYWHTTQDTPDKCSGESICKVIHVVWTWIQRNSAKP